MKASPSFVKENNVIDLKDLDLTDFLDLSDSAVELNNEIVEKILSGYKSNIKENISEDMFIKKLSSGLTLSFFYFIFFKSLGVFLSTFIVTAILTGLYSSQSVFMLNLMTTILVVMVVFHPILDAAFLKWFKNSKKYLFKQYNINLNDKTNIGKIKLLSLVSVFLSSKYCSYNYNEKKNVLNTIINCFYEKNSIDKIEYIVFNLVSNCYQGFINLDKIGFVSLDGFTDSLKNISNINDIANKMITEGTVIAPNVNTKSNYNGDIKEILSEVDKLPQEQKDWFLEDFIKTGKLKYPSLFSSENNSYTDLVGSLVAFAIILNSTKMKERFDVLDRETYLNLLIKSYFSNVFNKDGEDVVAKQLKSFFERYEEKPLSTLGVKNIHLVDLNKSKDAINEFKKQMFLD